LAGRRAEAAEHYKTLRDDDAAQRKEAAEALRKADKLSPDEKSRLESIVAAPAAENVVRSAFYGAALLLEQGRAQDAREALAAFLKTYPDSALADEAELRQAYCLLELRRFAEVRRSLEDLQKRPQLADRALWWLARAEWASASPSNAQAARTATDLLGRAADRAGELGKQNREAKSRRGEILLDLAEIQYATKAYRDAAATCQKVLADSASPERAEEASARLAAALHLSGQYKASDDACQKFERAYTNSTRLPTILFYEAENARLIALDPPADKGRNKQDVRALSEEAVKRYRRLLKDHPAMPTANLARFGLASVQCQMGQYAEALAALAEIPAAERTGELLAASCLEADCRLRTLPQEPSDAVPAADLIDRLHQAAKLLEGCVAAQGDGPEAADALMKTGHCYQRIASLLADAAEQKAMLVQARQAYDRSLKDRGKTSEAAQAAAVFERAKCLALLGEAETAAGDLARFQSDPWRGLPVAPAAMIFWSELNRAQGSAPEAAKVLAQYRSYFEAGRGARPDQSQWIAALQLEQAMALRESGKFSEARTLLENLLRQFEKRPEAALARREIQQCRREQLAAAVVAAHEALGKPEVKSEQRAALAKALEDGQNSIRPIAESAKAKAAELAKSAGSQAHLQALYEAACCYGTLAEAEIETARQKLHKQAVERIAPDPKKKSGAPGAKTVVPPAPVGDVPAQPSEKTARELYAALIAAAGVTPLAARAKLELAELHASRGESADAVRLWQQVLKEHPDSPWAEAAKQRLAALQ
jgi:TolA-binding protein